MVASGAIWAGLPSAKALFGISIRRLRHSARGHDVREIPPVASQP